MSIGKQRRINACIHLPDQRWLNCLVSCDFHLDEILRRGGGIVARRVYVICLQDVGTLNVVNLKMTVYIFISQYELTNAILLSWYKQLPRMEDPTELAYVTGWLMLSLDVTLSVDITDKSPSNSDHVSTRSNLKI